jgi:hypothetical protein
VDGRDERRDRGDGTRDPNSLARRAIQEDTTLRRKVTLVE